MTGLEISGPVLVYILLNMEIITWHRENDNHFRNVTKKVFGEIWGITGNFPKKAGNNYLYKE